jgi:hypothetical protein
MKSIRYLCLFALLFFFSGIEAQRQYHEIIRENPSKPFHEIVNEVEKYYEHHDKGRGSGYKQFKRWEYFNERRLNERGFLQNYSKRALEEFIDYRDDQKSLEEQNYGCSWEQVPTMAHEVISSGHNGGLGRVNCIARDPEDPDIVYVGTPGGGIWKTTNGGGIYDPASNDNNWESLSDGLPFIGVSGIAIDPTSPAGARVIYILTGDGDSFDNPSIGVLKSFDGGVSWYQTGLEWAVEDFMFANKLRIHPDDPNTLFVASNAGIHRTTDGGLNWTLEAGGFFTDIEFKPGAPETMYATSLNSFWISVNSGDTWTQQNNGLVALSTRLEIAVTPADPEVVYLLSGGVPSVGGAAVVGMFTGLYRSDDSGGTFTLQSNTPNILGRETDGQDTIEQSFFDLSIAVSPSDEDVVVVGGINCWRSENAGEDWINSSYWVEYLAPPGQYTHADIHALEYYGNTLYCGSDGGIFVSIDDAQNWTNISQGLQVTQCYRIAAFSDGGADYVMLGTQDNGLNQIRDDGSGWGPLEHWEGADGFEVSVDVDNDRVYAAIQNGETNVYTYPNIAFDTIKKPEGGPWLTPHVYNNDLDLLIAGYVDVWTTPDDPTPWTNITNGQIGGGFCTHVDVAPSNSNVIYVAKNQAMYKTTNGGTTWTNITAGIPANFNHIITYFAIDPTDSERVWITLGGFIHRTDNGYVEEEKVFFTPDGGATWQNFSGSLPNLPANCIIYEQGSNDGLYLGMDVGVYYRDAEMSDWILFSNGLPNAIISELDINYTSGKLFAGTYGRGVWYTDLFDDCGEICLDCPSYDGIHSLPSTYKALDCIYSTAVVYDNTVITYQVDDTDDIGEILLTDGFTVQGSKGAVFNAIFEECTFPSQSRIIPQANYRKLSGYYVGRLPGEMANDNSEEAYFDTENAVRLKTFPNPVSETINLEFQVEEPALVEIRLFDIFGRLAAVLEKGRMVEKGKNTLSFPVDDLPNGSYLLETYINGKSFVNNFIKTE